MGRTKSKLVASFRNNVNPPSFLVTFICNSYIHLIHLPSGQSSQTWSVSWIIGPRCVAIAFLENQASWVSLATTGLSIIFVGQWWITNNLKREYFYVFKWKYCAYILIFSSINWFNSTSIVRKCDQRIYESKGAYKYDSTFG